MPGCVQTYSLCIQQLCRVVVEEMAPLCGTTSWQDLLCKDDNFSKLLSISVDSSATNFVLDICHAWSVCCDLILHW